MMNYLPFAFLALDVDDTDSFTALEIVRFGPNLLDHHQLRPSIACVQL
jgi:hypothetical protein